MSQQKISDVKIKAIFKMWELGFSISKISRLLAISRLTVGDRLYPERYERRRIRSRDYIRKRVIITGSSKDSILVIRGLDKRPHTGACELCSIEDENRKLYYHHWDPDCPSVGVWVCFNCHRLAELIDEKGMPVVFQIISRYSAMRSRLSKVKNESVL